MFISTRDQARFGYLFLRNGKWKDKQLISEKWIQMLRVPSKAKPNYGYMWWLNNEYIFSAVGFGGNYVTVDQQHDLVVVARWLEPSTANKLLMMVLDSVRDNEVPDRAGAADLGTVKEKAAKNYSEFVGCMNLNSKVRKCSSSLPSRTGSYAHMRLLTTMKQVN